jgi:hypothetical protein
MLQQAYTPSNTGIASFVHASADYDLAPIGIGSMQEQVGRLAEFGRNGDIYVVHAAEGETVIPMEVLDSNPQIKEMLFAQMRDMGMDPERYVVGNELNSINPNTGMPEFWFKSIWKSVKKVFKAVAPIIVPIIGNAILPGIGGILASMAYTKLSGGSWGDTLKAGIMSYAGSALMAGVSGIGDPGGFIGGLESGLTAPFDAVSNLSGAFDAGIFGSGATAAAPAAASGAAGTGGTGAAAGTGGASATPAGGFDAAGGFQAGADQGLGWAPDPVGAVSGSSAAGLTPGTGLTLGGGSNVDFFPEVIGADTLSGGAASQSYGNYLAGRTPGTLGPGTQVAGGGFDPSYLPQNAIADPNAAFGYDALGGGDAWSTAGSGADPNAAFGYDALGGGDAAAWSTQPAKQGFFGRNLGLDEVDEYSSKAGDYLFRGGDTQQVVDQNMLEAENAYIARRAAQGIKPTEAGIGAARAGAGPSIYAKYGPSLALAGGAAYLGGAFDAPEDPDKEAREEAQRRFEEATSPSRKNALLESDPDSYEIYDLDPYKYRPAPNPRSYQGTRAVNFARAAAPPPYLQNSPDYARYSAAGGGFIDGQPQYLNYGGTAQYPRREMLVEGPGTERSDDIPAMLSDGEFVLNSRSVRGADPTGQGNRYRGAQNLYNMMRNFEMKG